MSDASQCVRALGVGSGGVDAAMHLERALVDRREMQQVPAHDVDLAHVVNPVRKLLKRVRCFVGDVAPVSGMRFSGLLAWFEWRTIHLSKPSRAEKKLRVALDWTLDLVFSKNLVRFGTPRSRSASR